MHRLIKDNKTIFCLFVIMSILQTILFIGRENAVEVNNVTSSAPRAAYVFKRDFPPAATCKPPQFDLHNLTGLASPHYKKMKPIQCKKVQKDLVTITSTGDIYLNEDKLSAFPNLSCSYQPISRKNKDSDDQLIYKDKLPLKNHAHVQQDIVFVQCYSEGKSVYEDLRILVHPVLPRNVSSNKDQKTKNEDQKPSVLIFGMDSLSRLNSLRSQPQLNRFLLDELDAKVFQLHVKVGRNTKPNMTPLLTGKRLDQWHDKGPEITYGSPWTTDGFIDKWPLIWKTFEEKGYITAYGEDEPSISTFNYMKKGFSRQPTHHYLRPFWLAWRKFKKKPIAITSSKKCFLNRAKYAYTLDWLVDLMRAYNNTPFFGFCLSTFTHQHINEHGILDLPVLEMVKTLHQENLLNNTILMILGDHGIRFGKFRQTQIGRVEDNMPYLSIVIPDSLKKKYPHLQETLEYNTQSLTTWYDLHETLLDIANGNFQDRISEVQKPLKRGLSLLSKIPRVRSCTEAGIPLSYCSCLSEKELRLNDSRIQSAVKTVLDEIQNQINKVNVCEELTLKKVKTAYSLDLQNEQQFLPDISNEGIIITIQTKENNGIYEAIILYNKSSQQHFIEGSISRLDPYVNQGKCAKNGYVQQFCKCK